MRTAHLLLPAVLLATPLALPMAAQAGSSSAVATSSSYSYGVSGHGRVTYGFDENASGLAVDPAGGRHVLWYDATSDHPVHYFSQAPGTSTWLDRRTSLRVSDPESNHLEQATKIALELTADRKRIVAVASDCSGIYTVSASPTASALPRLRKAIDEPSAVCDYQLDEDDEVVEAGELPRVTLIDAVALPHRRLGMLIWSKPLGGAVLYIGRPGRSFHPEGGVVPGSASYDQFTRDPASGLLVTVGTTDSATAPTMYAVTMRPGHSWSAPVVIATGVKDATHSTAYFAESIAASRKRVFVATGVSKQVGTGDVGGSNVLLFERRRDGTWTGPSPLPNTNPNTDGSPVLLTNPSTSHVHLAFSRRLIHSHPEIEGAMQSTLLKGKWTKPKFAVSGCDCWPVDLAINPAGNVVIGYQSIREP